MRNYYQALEVAEQASASEIRRAYRRLVLLTHPDRTTDPAAHARYLLINEAYETLSDPARRQRYDAALQQPAVLVEEAPTDEPHPDPALRRRGRRRPHPVARPPVPPLHIRYAAEFGRIVPRLRTVAILSLLGALLVLIDFSRTEVLPNEAVEDFVYVSLQGRRTSTTYFIVSTQHARFEVETTTNLEKGDRVTVRQTPWFRKVQQVNMHTDKPNEVELRTTNFLYAWMLIAILIGSAVGTLYSKLRLDQAFNLGFVNSVATILLILFLLFM
ncbi:MAG TPA: J domain-containing protein [Hymenobacter sp.]|jgi:hypothetical protein